MNPKHIIIDSSVAIKWYLPDEENDEALKIKSDFNKRIVLIDVPILFFYEVSNVLRTTTKQLRIENVNSTKAYYHLLDLNFNTYSSKDLFKKALEKAFTLDISSYDASYIVLAEHLQIPFYSADEKLVRKAGHELVLHLRDY